MSQTCTGQIITSYGRRYIVETPEGVRYDCTTRGKKTDYACGDHVDLLVQNAEQAVIERAQRADIFTRGQRQQRIAQRLQGHTSVLVGQSGMGKSTITNALLPDACARVGEISTALDSGRHTTTHAQLYHLDADSHLIDSPGLQEFGLRHLHAPDLIHEFPELRPYIGQCRFHNCSHRVEPGCALIAAAQSGAVSAERLAFLQKLTDELSPRG